jgi:SAM-dependent methyltransferase
MPEAGAGHILMPTEDTDKDWEYFGKTDPYWAVLTDDKFRKDNLTDDLVQSFFASGEAYVAFVFQTIRQHLDADFAPTSALDFGCGVGRLVIPLARACESVVGIDISEGMLQEAQARCDSLSLSNVRFEKSDDQLSCVSGRFDLINSYIVLQHIPPNRGELIANCLIERLSDGGVGVLHFVYHVESRSRRPKLRSMVESWGLYPAVCAVRRAGKRLARLLPWYASGKREMQMNAYDLNSLVLGLQKGGVRRVHVELTNHRGCYGVLLFFKRQSDDRYRA